MHKWSILLVFSLVSLSAFSFSEVKTLRFDSGVDQVNKNEFAASSVTASAKDRNNEVVKVNITCQKKSYNSAQRKMVKAGSLIIAGDITKSATINDKCDEFSKLIKQSNGASVEVKINYTDRSIEVEKL